MEIPVLAGGPSDIVFLSTHTLMIFGEHRVLGYTVPGARWYHHRE